MNSEKTHNSHSATVLSVWLRPLAEYLDGMGFDSREIFEQGGVDVNNIFLPSARVPLSRAAKLWKTAAELTQKPFVGLEVFKQAPPMQGDTMAVAMMASRNLYEALQRMSRLVHVICDGVDFTVTRHNDQLQCDFIVHPENRDIMPAEAMDPSFLLILNMTHLGFSNNEAVVQLGFQRPQPEQSSLDHLTELLGHNIIFNCDHYYFLVDWHKSQIANPYWNPSLAQLSEELALKDLQQLKEENIIARTRTLILEHLGSGTPQQDAIASAMNLSTRQLQRKLSSQGITFGELLQQVRLTLALEYLKDPLMAMVDIGLSLGFQDQSNFVKAYKKWTGETPGQYRKRVIG
jgi:AraC-like DNA-binding protein